MTNEREEMEVVTKTDPISEACERIKTLTTATRDLQRERARAVDAMGDSQLVVQKTIADLADGAATAEQLLKANQKAMQATAAVTEIEGRMRQVQQALSGAHRALADAEQARRDMRGAELLAEDREDLRAFADALTIAGTLSDKLHRNEQEAAVIWGSMPPRQMFGHHRSWPKLGMRSARMLGWLRSFAEVVPNVPDSVLRTLEADAEAQRRLLEKQRKETERFNAAQDEITIARQAWAMWMEYADRPIENIRAYVREQLQRSRAPKLKKVS